MVEVVVLEVIYVIHGKLITNALLSVQNLHMRVVINAWQLIVLVLLVVPLRALLDILIVAVPAQCLLLIHILFTIVNALKLVPLLRDMLILL
jgi:hypothetical protein